jgi:mono/diheme cytochrome c family protein
MRGSTGFVRGALLAVAAAVALPLSAQDRADDGAAQFQGYGCAACHGPNGQGAALAPSIAGPGLAAESFRAAVRRPRGAMPAFTAAALSDETLESIRGYLGEQTPPAAPAGRAEAGALRFEQVGCYSCHSNQGQGGTQGPRIGPDPIRWERFAWYVRHPAGQMPPYSQTALSDQDLADIREFLATRPEPRPLDSIPLLAVP